MSQGWLEQDERGTVFGIRLLVGTALLLGRRVARWVLVPVCVYFVLFSVRSRAASRKYLSKVLQRAPGFGDLFRHYFSFAVVALDRVFLLKERVNLFDATIHGEECLVEILRTGKACLLLGAHLGSFEILRAFGASRQLRVSLVMYEENARMVNTVTRAINTDVAQSVIGLGRFDSMLKLQQRLVDNEWVGMLGDRALRGDAQLAAPFLGDSARFPTAPFRIALMLQRPVVLMLGLYRGGNRYDLYFERLFDASNVPRSERERAIEQAVRTYAERLDHYCRQAPFNWFNFYDFWAD